MRDANIISVSWGDHLIFGEGDGQLATPDALARRMAAWKAELGAAKVHWRAAGRVPGRVQVGREQALLPVRHPPPITWNDLRTVPEVAADARLAPYLYMTALDEGWPLPRRAVRERSHHNPFHARHRSFQSAFAAAHPEMLVTDRRRRRRQWGVPCLGYPEVRAHLRDRYLGLLSGTGFRGLFLCFRSQSRPPDHADLFGFNPPVREAYLERYGRDIWSEPFDPVAWRALRGDFVTIFLRELRRDLGEAGFELALGVPRGDVFGPPIGNMALPWRQWLDEGLVDDLVIDQDSTRCPSMWIDLWPMHRRARYLQDYSTGAGLPPLERHLAEAYAPAVSGGARLYVAWQWSQRDPAREAALRATPGVSGLVFSSFRHDNAASPRFGNWWG